MLYKLILYALIIIAVVAGTYMTKDSACTLLLTIVPVMEYLS